MCSQNRSWYLFDVELGRVPLRLGVLGLGLEGGDGGLRLHGLALDVGGVLRAHLSRLLSDLNNHAVSSTL